ncbi:MAG: hypothetical protein M3345_00360 [Actinomycetota bacterium]|nr:hypothetical protein [Actinomycetota bacterium]
MKGIEHLRERLSRAPLWLRWGILVLGNLLLFAAIALALLSNPHRPAADRLRAIDVIWALSVESIPAVGFLVLLKRPSNPVAWLLSTLGLALPAGLACSEYMNYALSVPGSGLPAATWVGWMGNWLFAVGMGSLVLTLLLFPEGTLPSPRWRWVVRALGVVLFAIAGSQFAPISLSETTEIPNPAAIPGADFLKTASDAGFAGLLMLVLVSATAPMFRMRRSRGIERLQLRWFALGAAGFVLMMVAGFGLEAIAPGDQEILGTLLVVLAMLSLSTGMAVAILKYRLYDIDLVINRTLVYGSLTALLGLTYLGLVTGTSTLLGDSPITVAASTLAVAALFRPLRAWIQAFIDRRFYRQKYDAQRTVDEFSARLRDEVSLDSLSGHLLDVVQDTMQPARVSLWLRDTEPSQ